MTTSLDFARWYFDTKPSGDGPKQAPASPRAPWVAPPPCPRTIDWTLERIAALSSPEVSQLRANAERLQDPAIAARCADVLKERTQGRARPNAAAPAKKALRATQRAKGA